MALRSVSDAGSCDVWVWFSEVWPGKREKNRHCWWIRISLAVQPTTWTIRVSPCALHPPPKHRFSAATMGDLWPAAIHHCLHLGCSPDEPARSRGSALADTSIRPNRGGIRHHHSIWVLWQMSSCRSSSERYSRNRAESRKYKKTPSLLI